MPDAARAIALVTRRAARRAAASVEPPTRIIGWLRGFGVTRIVRPRHSNGSPVHALRSTSTYSSRSFPRWARSTPAIANSSAR